MAGVSGRRKKPARQIGTAEERYWIRREKLVRRVERRGRRVIKRTDDSANDKEPLPAFQAMLAVQAVE